VYNLDLSFGPNLYMQIYDSPLNLNFSTCAPPNLGPVKILTRKEVYDMRPYRFLGCDHTTPTLGRKDTYEVWYVHLPERSPAVTSAQHEDTRISGGLPDIRRSYRNQR
jgi:hypothetical protein